MSRLFIQYEFLLECHPRYWQSLMKVRLVLFLHGRYEHIVESITQAHNEDEVLVEACCENGQKLSARRAIITLPLGVLRHGPVRVVPPLPGAKLEHTD